MSFKYDSNIDSIPMYCKIAYNETTDLQPVDQFGFIDIVSAMSTGVVANSENTDSLKFDGEDVDPANVGRRVKNNFDAIDNLQDVVPSE